MLILPELKGGILCQKVGLPYAFIVPCTLRKEHHPVVGRAGLNRGWIGLRCGGWNLTTHGARQEPELLEPFSAAKARCVRPGQC